jgi:hypothetical protein
VRSEKKDEVGEEVKLRSDEEGRSGAAQRKV